LDHASFFGKYRGADVLDVAKRLMPPRTLVAYNQAGFVPFMLDLHNIDNLGICSKFYSGLPSTDVYFTEVGRYTPLTDSPSIRAGEAYLLYRDVPFVLAGYNSGLAPDQLFGGYYRKIATIRGEGLYTRTDRSTAAYRSDPTLFLENLGHVSSLRNVRINGRPLVGAAIKAALPFFRDEYGWVNLEHGTFVLEAQLADADATVYEIDINGIIATTPASVAVELISSTGSRQVALFETEGGESTPSFFQRIDGPSASRLRLTISGHDDRVWLRDVRIQGQTAALAAYIRKSLTFAPLSAADTAVVSDGRTRVP